MVLTSSRSVTSLLGGARHLATARYSSDEQIGEVPKAVSRIQLGVGPHSVQWPVAVLDLPGHDS